MNRNDDNIGNLLNSFKRVCSELEKKTEINLIQISKECKQECVESEKAIQKFNELTSRIAEICSEINNNSDVLNLTMKQTVGENTLNVPYEMHSDLVKCISGLYNMDPTPQEPEEKFISKNNEKLINSLINLGGKVTVDVKDIESTLIEAKENLKAVTKQLQQETCHEVVLR